MTARTKAERREASSRAKRPKKPLEDAYPPRVKSKTIEIVPKNPRQADYIDALYTDGLDIILATGPAGTGKTFIPSLYGIRELKHGEFKRIVITRPIIPNGEEIGIFPGGPVEKLGPWVRPIIDAMRKVISMAEIEALIEKDILEISPLELMRGRSLDDTLVIADEMQNATASQVKMLMTRIGENSRIVITGDLEQRDRDDAECGLLDFVRRLQAAPRKRQNRFKMIEFLRCDIERHPIIDDVLAIYGD